MIKWVILIIIASGVIFMANRAEAPFTEIIVKNPSRGEIISSPLDVSGEARGSWYFEASAPVTILDKDGEVLGQGYVTAQGDWMTTEFVPFEGTIIFDVEGAEEGEVVFKNDNPSGEPARDKFLRIPVRFSD